MKLILDWLKEWFKPDTQKEQARGYAWAMKNLTDSNGSPEVIDKLEAESLGWNDPCPFDRGISQALFEWARTYPEPTTGVLPSVPWEHTPRSKDVAALEERIQAAYAAVPESIRDDIVSASVWARNVLTELDGSGHEIYVTASGEGLVCCSFAKPSWGGDHCGRGMEHGAEAIVMAVCEYRCGA